MPTRDMGVLGSPTVNGEFVGDSGLPATCGLWTLYENELGLKNKIIMKLEVYVVCTCASTGLSVKESRLWWVLLLDMVVFRYGSC